MSPVYRGAEPGDGEPLRGTAHEGSGETSSDSGGDAKPTTEREPPRTDPEVKDVGEPPEETAAPEGSSGAEQGLSPWAPEAYSDEPAGPTTSTAD